MQEEPIIEYGCQVGVGADTSVHRFRQDEVLNEPITGAVHVRVMEISSIARDYRVYRAEAIRDGEIIRYRTFPCTQYRDPKMFAACDGAIKEARSWTF